MKKQKKWSGSTENYKLKDSGDTTELIVDMDIIEDFEEYFKTKFPKALEKVKQLSEGQK